MRELDLFLGPAIVAAVISGVVSLVLVQMNFRQERRAEKLRRDEKVRDFQIALRAEIASDLLNMQVVDRAAFLADIRGRYAADPGYSVIVPRMAENPVFAALIGEIHILPGAVIDPVVHYERLRQTIERFVLDLRAPEFAGLSAERQLSMYGDYLDMLGRLELLAGAAHAALVEALNSRGAGPSSRSPAVGEGGASAGNSSS